MNLNSLNGSKKEILKSSLTGLQKQVGQKEQIINAEFMSNLTPYEGVEKVREGKNPSLQFLSDPIQLKVLPVTLIHRKSIRVRRFHSSRTSRTFDGED
jgi:hypothetical protein